jgi:hypothetical protein
MNTPTNNLPHSPQIVNTFEADYIELIAAFKALQADYEKIGWVNTEIYARACRALDKADKTLTKMLALLNAGENIQDYWKHQGKED